MTNLFIAPKIKVGFQNRSDTFTQKLAYVVYFDEKGKLRKEKSWEGWRDKKIEPQEFENIPTSGFTINKDIKRHNWEWWSSTRTMVRIHDPRGFEFEVTTENLITILMHTDCSKRGLIGDFVYAWAGTELVLLPTNSVEYQEATKYTTGLSKKIAAKNLIVGATYKHKKNPGEYTYMGRLNYYQYKGSNPYKSEIGSRSESKEHIFYRRNGGEYRADNFVIESAPNFAECLNDQCVPDFADLMDRYKSNIYAGQILSAKFVKVDIDLTERIDETYRLLDPMTKWQYQNRNICPSITALRKDGDKYSEVILKRYSDNLSCDADLRSYYCRPSDYYYYSFDPQIYELKCHETPRHKGWSGYSWDPPKNLLTAEQAKNLDLYHLKVKLDTGKEVLIKSLDQLKISL
jgi:hypothetical protein